MADAIVVTGASGALGEAVVRCLVAQELRVAALGSQRSEAKLAALSAELGASCFPCAFDVASAEAWAEALPRIEGALGPVGGAVLSVGGWQGGTPFVSTPDDAILRAMVAQNLDTAERSMRALLPDMVARGRGSVVVIGARAAALPHTGAGAAAYTASKAALVALSQVIAAEVLASGVRVNALLPSTIDTPSNRAAMPDADHARWVSLARLAATVAFLLSDDAADISGAAIPVYGRV